MDIERLQSIWFRKDKWQEQDIMKWWAWARLPMPSAIGPAAEVAGCFVAEPSKWDVYHIRDPKTFKQTGFTGQKMGDGSLMMIHGTNEDN